MLQGVLDNRYEILERIGGGGMADVYKAHDKILDRVVAVKILHAQLAGDKEFLAKFQMEAQGAARLSHPNIVNIYDVGVEDGMHYIVMEYVDGETLKDKITREGHLSIPESLKIAKEIAEALSHAHKNNLVHCYVKPHNILVMQDGRVKVADFG
ncbi:MAG: serine/threonine protein kinase, partial [Schwartzia sp.]|nr:serine/threonine protein kinase [Schwartzia sp. (in: firmicutes)]